MDFNNLDALMSHIQKVVTDILDNEVKDASITIMQEKVGEEIYAKYSPTHYERTGQLKESCKAEMIDSDTLEVKNTRQDEETGRYVAPVIEYGKGYYSSELDKRIGERPFIEETAKALKDGKAVEAMKKGLKRILGNVL